MRLLLLCGPAYAGKTALAMTLEAHGIMRISLDEIARSRGLGSGAKVTEREWQDVSFAACLLVSSAAQRGLDAVVEDTLHHRSMRDRYREVGEAAGMSVFLVVLKLASHLASFEWPGSDEPHIGLDASSPLERQLSQLTRAIRHASAQAR